MEVSLERRGAVAILLSERPDDLFVVPGLGSTTYDVASLGDDDRNFYLWGAMGGAAMIGLGLALARPHLRILVLTGDGEMLMGLGSLATIGVQQPKNLAVVVFDNGVYGETGMQDSAARAHANLAGVARACGIDDVQNATDEPALRRLAAKLKTFDRTLFARVRIRADEPPRVLPTRDGVELKLRFRRAVMAAGA
jgi:thiamine pyrophosphate-dependent acetolactate synthase large subunit-like protein